MGQRSALPKRAKTWQSKDIQSCVASYNSFSESVRDSKVRVLFKEHSKHQSQMALPTVKLS